MNFRVMRCRWVLIGLVFLQACAFTSGPVATAPSAIQRSVVKLPHLRPAFPGLRLEMRGPVTPTTTRSVERIPGVSVAVPFAIQRAPVSYRGDVQNLRVVAVYPLAFRNVAPASTQAADFVWTSLIDGRAVLTAEAAHRLRFDAGEISVRTAEMAVGAFADNGIPNLGDLVVAKHVARTIGLRPASQILVGLSEGADVTAIRRAIRNRLGGRLRTIYAAPRNPASTTGGTPDPVGTAQGELIGSMNFRILKNGFIEPDPNWVAANIGSGEVPILGSVTCHRVVFPQLRAALAEIEERGLARKIDRDDFGGCYVPRFIGRDRRRGLSAHAFGLALDLNVSTNQVDTRGGLDARIVAIFEKWGFEWGGRWSPPDPMHFELARLIEV